MTTAIGARDSQLAVLAPYSVTPSARVAQLAALVVYAPPSSKLLRAGQSAALTPYSTDKFTVPRTSQLAALIVYATGTPNQARSRAWAFTLDGHTFYVLNLSEEGTFVYDVTTQQWSKFETDGFGQWNMLVGTMWDTRIVAGDSVAPTVWELDPNAVQDEGWRSINHVVTGIVTQRGRTYVSCDAVRLAASVGQIDDLNGAAMTLEYSDDQGQTWTTADPVQELVNGDYTAEIAWRSLGAFSSPGRIFRISDTGGVIRIDGADMYPDNFDETPDDGSA